MEARRRVHSRPAGSQLAFARVATALREQRRCRGGRGGDSTPDHALADHHGGLGGRLVVDDLAIGRLR